VPSRIRSRRIDPEQLLVPGAAPADRAPAVLADRVAAARALDLGARIGLAADLQATAGNAATAAALGSIRTDKPQSPAGGVQAIVDATKKPNQRGLTRSSFDANRMPLFKVQRPAQEGGAFTTKAVVPRLPDPDHEVWWPAEGRHLLGPYGKGKRWLQVTGDWSKKLKEGEDRHVEDMDLAYQMTWGRVRDVLAEMAAQEKPYTGATSEAALQAAWKDFKRRLPPGFRPEGDTPTKEAQEAVWGPDDPKSVFSRMWRESARARDDSGEHTPSEEMLLEKGNDLINELKDGNSKTPGRDSKTVMTEAWDRILKR
jgi:hypothetical protein